MRARHKDKKRHGGDEHEHAIGVPLTKDGRYNGGKMLNHMRQNFNQNFARCMRERGWDMDDLDLYDPSKKNDEEYMAERREKRRIQGRSVNDYGADEDARQAEQNKQAVAEASSELADILAEASETMIARDEAIEEAVQALDEAEAIREAARQDAAVIRSNAESDARKTREKANDDAAETKRKAKTEAAEIRIDALEKKSEAEVSIARSQSIALTLESWWEGVKEESEQLEQEKTHWVKGRGAALISEFLSDHLNASKHPAFKKTVTWLMDKVVPWIEKKATSIHQTYSQRRESIASPFGQDDAVDAVRRLYEEKDLTPVPTASQ